MKDTTKVFIGVAALLGGVTVLHGAFNVEWPALVNDLLPESERKLNIGYIPVT